MCQHSPALVRTATLRIAFAFLFSFLDPLGALGQGPQQQSASIDGSYTFVQDSNGGKAPANLRITLKLASGTAVLSSSPSHPMYSDRGSYEFQGGVLRRFVLPHIGKFVANKPASLRADSLTLPFMLLGPGAGSSTWEAPQVAVAHLPAEVAALIDQIIARMNLRIPPQVQTYLMQSVTPGRDQAAQYMRLGTALNFAGQVPEAIWALAHAAKLLPDTHILSNLGHALSLDADYAGARTILQAAYVASPNNHFILNNLAYANYQQDRFEQAEMAERKAVALNPEPEYLWSLCKILRAEHKEMEGKKYCDAAVDKGMMFILNPQPKKPDQPKPPGNKTPDERKPPEDQPPPPDEIPPETRPDLKPPEGNEDKGAENAPDADPEETIIGQIGKRDKAHDQKPPKPYDFPSNPKPLAELSKTAANWVGHWEGEKVTGCIHRTRKFGSGMAMTMVKENICHYAQKLSFDVDDKGKIDGQGEAVYVFHGKGDNPALMMSPIPLPPGGFFATFQGGYRIRKFKIEGTVMPDGTVSIGGRPEKPLYLLNVYMWQKIYGWNVFPPPPDHPGQPGILKIGKRGNEWTMEATSHNNVSAMNYETLIYKTGRKFNMVKGCKLYCSKEPMAQSMGMEQKVEDAKCGVSAGPVEIKGNGSVIEASAKVSAGEMNLGEIKVEANYGKPGELEEAMKKDAMAGCATASEGEGGEEGETPGSVKGHAKVLNFGFSVERNPIAGDETFGLGVIEAEGPKMETEEGGVKAEVTPKASFQLVVNSHCGFGMKWEVKAEVATGAEGEVGKTKVGAGCSKEVSVEGTAWAGSNIVD